MDSSLHLVPGRYKLPTAPGGSLRKDCPGLEKAENKFAATSGLPACVCVSCVASIYARVCSSVSCVPLKPDIHTYIHTVIRSYTDLHTNIQTPTSIWSSTHTCIYT